MFMCCLSVAVAPEFYPRLGTSHPSSQQLDVIERFSTKSSQGEHAHFKTQPSHAVSSSNFPSYIKPNLLRKPIFRAPVQAQSSRPPSNIPYVFWDDMSSS